MQDTRCRTGFLPSKKPVRVWAQKNRFRCLEMALLVLSSILGMLSIGSIVYNLRCCDSKGLFVVIDLKDFVPATWKLAQMVYNSSGSLGLGERLLAPVIGKQDAKDVENRVKDCHRLIRLHKNEMKATKGLSSDELAQLDNNIVQYIQERILYKKQNNFMNVIRGAVDILGNKQVSNHDIDEDLTDYLFSCVQDVSTEELQQIWSRILAGEVEKPNSTSRFTMSILKNMSQKDAKLFEKVAKYVFSGHLLRDHDNNNNFADYPTPDDLVMLDSFGLLNNNDGLACLLAIPDGELYTASHTMLFRISAPNKVKLIQIPSYPLTPQGKELYKAIGIDPNTDFLQAIADWLHHKYEAKVEKAYKEGTFQDKSGKTKIKHSKLVTISPKNKTK